MIIATFNSTAEWAGRTISFDGDTFTVEGLGELTADEVMLLDADGQLSWVSAETRDLIVASVPATQQVSPLVPEEQPTQAKLTARPLSMPRPAATDSPAPAAIVPPVTEDRAETESEPRTHVLIATFGPTTAWVGKTITFEDERFALEGHGRVSPQNVMRYDEKGQLTWASDGMRAWVGSQAREHRPADLVASFNPSTGWLGKTITHEDRHFVLGGHGRVSPTSIMKYDAAGQLTWKDEETRVWIQSRAFEELSNRKAARASIAGARQPSGLHTPWGTLTPLAGIGLGLVVVGFLTFIYFIGFFDTTVFVDTSNGYTYSIDRVNNIGLQNDQRNGIIFGLVLAAVGGALLVVANSRGDLRDFLSKAPAPDMRKCPYCAEQIKVDAVVCRFCNRGVPRGGRRATT